MLWLEYLIKPLTDVSQWKTYQVMLNIRLYDSQSVLLGKANVVFAQVGFGNNSLDGPWKNKHRISFHAILPYTVYNKKHIPPVFQPFVFPIYLRNRLSYKKSIYIFLYYFLKSFQLEKEFFKSDDKFSWYLLKCQFSNKKLAIRKKPPFWKISKKKILVYKVKDLNLHINKISTQKDSHNLF